MINEGHLLNIMKIFPKEEIQEDLLENNYHAKLVYKYGLSGLKFVAAVEVAKEHIEIVNESGSPMDDDDLVRIVSVAIQFK